MTKTEKIVLDAILRFKMRSASELSHITGLGTDDLYTALAQLEEEGKIEGEWDESNYPRTRRYRQFSNH
jgi:DNA-binding PadR family transcriptional regulator